MSISASRRLDVDAVLSNAARRARAAGRKRDEAPRGFAREGWRRDVTAPLQL